MAGQIMFGPWRLHKSEIFFVSRYSYGIVNTKPVVPGHVLVIPRRVLARYADLTAEEVADLAISAQQIGKVIEREFKSESLTITIQDGPASGQTVAHCHIHVIPRVKSDWMNNDAIYDDINTSSAEAVKERQKGPDAESRVARSTETMGEEAAMLKAFFVPFEDVWLRVDL